MAESDAQLRGDIATKISAVATDSVVFDHWVLGYLEGEWAGPLRDANPSGKVRAWIITRRAIDTERLAGGGKRKSNVYRLLFFMEYEGSQGESEDAFGAELDAVIDTLSGPASGLGLQVLRIDFTPAGGVLLHFAECELTITVC